MLDLAVYIQRVYITILFESLTVFMGFFLIAVGLSLTMDNWSQNYNDSALEKTPLSQQVPVDFFLCYELHNRCVSGFLKVPPSHQGLKYYTYWWQGTHVEVYWFYFRVIVLLELQTLVFMAVERKRMNFSVLGLSVSIYVTC